jgi:DNA-binding transcriptional ArsR family regulator
MDKFCNEAYYMFFSTLANRTRLAMLDVLEDGPKTVSEISTALKQEPAVIAQNLKYLTECAFLHSEGLGERKRYSLNKEIVEPLGHILAFHVAKHCPNLQRCIPEEKLKEYMKREAAKETYVEHG